MRNERYFKETFGRYYVNKPLLRALIKKHGTRKKLAKKIGVNDCLLYNIFVSVAGRVTEKTARKLLKKLGPKILLGRNPLYMPNVEYIKAQMKERHLSQYAASKSLNVAASTMMRILGGNSYVKPETAKKLIEFFGKESITKE